MENLLAFVKDPIVPFAFMLLAGGTIVSSPVVAKATSDAGERSAPAGRKFSKKESHLSPEKPQQVQLPSRKPIPLDPRLQLAVALAKKKKIDRALSVLDIILKEKPDDDQALMVRGRIFLQEERFGSAIKDFSAIIRRNPKSTTALVYRAKSYVLSKDFKNAVADCDRILALEPTNVAALYWRGTSRAYVFDMELGLRDLEKARSLKPHAQMFFTSGATYINLDRLNDAIDAYTKTLAMNPRHGLAYMIRGRCYYNLKNYRKAIKDYTLALENNKGYWRIYLLRALAYEKVGDKAKASRDLELASVNEPDMAVGFYSSSVENAVASVQKSGTKSGARGSSIATESGAEGGGGAGGSKFDSRMREAFKLCEKGDYKGALGVLDKALKQSPADASARYQHGKILMDMHDYDGAIADFIWVAHSDSTMAEQVSRLIAIAFYRNKEFQHALWACNGALFWDENWVEGYFFKAQALEALKRHAEARRFYGEFLQVMKNAKAVRASTASKTELAAWSEIARERTR